MPKPRYEDESRPAGAGELSDGSYPWMAPLGDGKWMLVFDAGNSRGSSSIYGMVIHPDP